MTVLDNKNEKLPKLNKIKESAIKLEITDYLERKIKEIAKKYPSIEWSGVLFYRIKTDGPFHNRVYEAIDALPMDFGNATYTNFCSDDERIPMFVVANGYEEDGIYMGLIHSHNTMGSTASGTDENTIAKECNERNVFMSLIVNNAGIYHCYMSRKVNKIVDMKCNKEVFDFNNIKTKKNAVSKENITVIECFDVEISYPEHVKLFMDDVNELYKKCYKPEQKMPFNIPAYSSPKMPLFDDIDVKLSVPQVSIPENKKVLSAYDEIVKLVDYCDDAYLTFLENEIRELEFLRRALMSMKKDYNSIVGFVDKVYESFDTRMKLKPIDVLYYSLIYVLNDEDKYRVCEKTLRNIINTSSPKSVNMFADIIMINQMKYNINIYIDHYDLNEFSDMIIEEAKLASRTHTDDKSTLFLDSVIKDMDNNSPYNYIVVLRLFAIMRLNLDESQYFKYLNMIVNKFVSKDNYNIDDFSVDGNCLINTFVSCVYEIIDFISVNESFAETFCLNKTTVSLFNKGANRNDFKNDIEYYINTLIYIYMMVVDIENQCVDFSNKSNMNKAYKAFCSAFKDEDIDVVEILMNYGE